MFFVVSSIIGIGLRLGGGGGAVVIYNSYCKYRLKQQQQVAHV